MSPFLTRIEVAEDTAVEGLSTKELARIAPDQFLSSTEMSIFELCERQLNNAINYLEGDLKNVEDINIPTAETLNTRVQVLEFAIEKAKKRWMVGDSHSESKLMLHGVDNIISRLHHSSDFLRRFIKSEIDKIDYQKTLKDFVFGINLLDCLLPDRSGSAKLEELVSTYRILFAGTGLKIRGEDFSNIMLDTSSLKKRTGSFKAVFFEAILNADKYSSDLASDRSIFIYTTDQGGIKIMNRYEEYMSRREDREVYSTGKGMYFIQTLFDVEIVDEESEEYGKLRGIHILRPKATDAS